jgi:hypothetical protein
MCVTVGAYIEKVDEGTTEATIETFVLASEIDGTTVVFKPVWPMTSLEPSCTIGALGDIRIRDDAGEAARIIWGCPIIIRLLIAGVSV